MKETRGSMPGKAESKSATATKASKTAAKAPAKAAAKAPAKAAAAKAPAKPAKEAAVKGTKERALLVVESPAKARTIKKYLGAAFTVKASVGHVKDLPKSKMGVDPDKDFEPEYVIIRGKAKVIQEIRKSAKAVDKVYLAP